MSEPSRLVPRTRLARSAESLVFGVDGPAVIVSARVAAVLMEQTGLAAFRRARRGDDAELDAALLALTLATIEYRNRTSGRGQERAPTPVTVANCALTTDLVADRLGCSARTVRRLIHNGSLPARRVGPLWLLDEDDLQTYADRRTT